jgi:hypothetical protein
MAPRVVISNQCLSGSWEEYGRSFTCYRANPRVSNAGFLRGTHVETGKLPPIKLASDQDFERMTYRVNHRFQENHGRIRDAPITSPV